MTNTKADFMECDACRAKPGTPDLCSGCLYNRELVRNLKEVTIHHFFFRVYEDKGFKISGRGVMTEGRAYGHNYPKDPKELCSLAPEGKPDFWLIRLFDEPKRFTSWGVEIQTCGGGGMVSGVGVPEDMDVRRGDLYMLCND